MIRLYTCQDTFLTFITLSRLGFGYMEQILTMPAISVILASLIIILIWVVFNMTVLLVGADNLGTIPEYLSDYGFEKIIHWCGRKTKNNNKLIPINTDMILVFSDFVNHNLMYNIKKAAKEKSIPILYSKRSSSCIRQTLERCCYGLNGCNRCPKTKLSKNI